MPVLYCGPSRAARPNRRATQQGDRVITGLLNCGLPRPPYFVGERPVGQRFGQMHAADFFGAVEIGKRAGDPQNAVIAARRQGHGVGGIAQQRHPAAVGAHHLFQNGAIGLGIGAHIRQSQPSIALDLEVAGKRAGK